MSFLSAIVPINLLEEKEKFFADQKYNPQFIYSKPIDQKKLNQYGKPQSKNLNLAQEILDRSYFGRNESDLFMMEGQKFNQQQVERKIAKFLQIHHIEDKFQISWSSSYVSRTTINRDTIKLRLPVDFRREGLLGMIYHELGTHAIRRVNYEKQPWYRHKRKNGLTHPYLTTEEGLASIHSLIPHSFKLNFIGAIRYLAIDYAFKHSFAQTWHFLSRYIQNLERRWIVTFRLKRGFQDTSKPGCFSKDLVYFDGFVQVLNYLQKNDFDISKLYYGKIALEDVEKAVQISPNFQPLLPSFFIIDTQKYAQEVYNIGKINNILNN